ncbi:MAG: glycoside hydrolase family 15 protein, partial [Desulfotomaculales bacterium]
RGSTWLSMVSGSREQLPIQEDETALVIWALWQHFKIYKDIDFIASVYDSLISPAADFMTFFRDEKTRLPLPGYDLWEERLGVFTYTAAGVTAGLRAAGQMALLLGDESAGTRWLNAAREVKQAIQEYLYSADVARFIRGYICDDRGDLVPDYTLDASLHGIFGFGLLPADDHRVVATMRALEDGLWV